MNGTLTVRLTKWDVIFVVTEACFLNAVTDVVAVVHTGRSLPHQWLLLHR